MRKLLLLALILFALPAFSQTPEELKVIINTGKENQRYDAVKGLIQYYISFQKVVGDTTHADSARKYFPVMNQLVGKGDTTRLVEYLLMEGWFKAKYNLLSSFEDIRIAIKASREYKSDRLTGESYLTAGMLMEKEVDFITGMQYYFAATNYFKLLKDERKLAFCYRKIGNLLTVYIQYDKAQEYLRDASDMFYKVNDLDQFAQTMERLTAVQLRSGTQTEAEATLARMESILKNKPYQNWLVKTYYNIADFFILTQNADNAQKYLSKAQSLVPFVRDTTVFKIMPNLGWAKLCILKGQMDQALTYLKSCEKDISQIALKDDDVMNIVQEINLTYYAYYITIGDGQKANEYAMKNQELNTQIQANLSDKIAAMVRVFEAEKEENYTIANLQEINEKQREINERQETKLNYLIILAALLLFVLAAIYYRYRERQKIAKYLETEVAARTQELKAQSEEKTLMLKEIHHRVKNNLQLISSFLNLQKHFTDNDKSTEEIITETQERVRCMAIIHEKLYSAESLSNLDTKSYLSEIAQFVYQSYANSHSSIEVHLNIESAKMALDKMIPCGLIINELLSNCFKYAFKGRTDGDIWVDFHTNGDHRYLKIRDNGIGLPADFSVEKLNSLGMNIVIGLVEQLDGQFATKNDGGTTFEITFV